VQDAGLLQSTLLSLGNLYFYGDPKPNIAKEGTAYRFGIRKNHPFNDGNKKMALIAVRLSLKDSWFDLTVTGTKKCQSGCQYYWQR
jgi:death on curing protein